MSPILATILALTALVLGYRFYSRFLANRVFGLTSNEKMPSEEFRDNVDYVPTSKSILWGHHFSSIAGAAPILGPAIAIVWGWVPALIWVVLGVIFMGAVHDFGALVISVREKGKTIADITGTIINKRVRTMFLIFVMMLSWLVLAVFAMAIAGFFVSIPSAELPVNIEILLALIMGYILYLKNFHLYNFLDIDFVVTFFSYTTIVSAPITHLFLLKLATFFAFSLA